MNFFENSKLVFFFFILIGFMVPGFADDLKFLLIPFVILMMILSIKDVHIGHITKKNYWRVLKLVLVNYFILSPVYIILSYILIKNTDFRNGLILLAVVPPAAAIIPLTYIYHGDLKDSILGEIACYLFALIYSPVVVFLFFKDSVDVFFFIKILLLIIILPMIVARLIHGLKWKIFHKKNIVVNLIYGFSIYIFIGINHETLTKDYVSLIPVTIVICITTFVLGFVTYTILKYKKVKKSHDIMYVLFGTFKNGNSAATLAILLFSPAAAIPVAVRGLLIPFYFAFLEWLFEEHKELVKT